MVRGEIRQKLGRGMHLLKLVLCCWKKGCKATKISETSCLDCDAALGARSLGVRFFFCFF